MKLAVNSKILIHLISLLLTCSLFGQQPDSLRKITLPHDTTRSYPLVNLDYQFPRVLKVSLVLSGGGARGFAHIGVLKAFEEKHIPFDLIVGSSIGSIIGGFYAAGYSPDQLVEIVKTTDWQELYSDKNYRTNLFWSQKSNPRRHILELRFDKGIPYIPSALTPGQKIFHAIYSRLLKANFQASNNFDNLRVAFRAVTTDLLSGKRVVLKDGNLAEAITASVTFPLLFAPVERDGMWLVDGGIRDNLPVDVARENGSDITIAVDVTSPLRTADNMRVPWQLADQVTTIMMQEPTRESRKMADVLIEPNVGKHKASDFSEVDQLVQAGYEAALRKIDSIRTLIQLKQKKLWGENRYLGKVEEIEILGLEHTELDTLSREMVTQSGYSLYLYDLYQDLQRFYRTGLLSDAYVILWGTPSAYRVEFHLRENPIIEHLEFKTFGVLPDSLLRRYLDLPLHRVLNFHLLFEKLDELRNVYVQKGYSFAHVTAIRFQPAQDTLQIEIDEGRIDSIHIQGYRVTRDYIILREFPPKPGQVFTAKAASEGIRNIYSTGLFDRVSMYVSRKDSQNTLIIKVKEKKYLLMRLGGNASLERKGTAFLEVAEDNLLGRNIKASLWGTIGENERTAEFKFYSVRLFKTLLTYRLRLYYKERWDNFYRDLERTGRYLTIRRGVWFVIGQQIERLGSITGELRWDNINIFSSEPSFSYRGAYRIRSLILRSVVDKRDKLPFPERGIYNRWYWETGNQRLLGSSEAFTRFYISLEGYYSLFSALTYRIQGEGGSADLTLPFSEFFTLGGLFNFPGLHEKERFGRQMIHLGNELRYKFRWHLPIDLYLGIEYHIGAVWRTSEDQIRRKDFLTSVGAYAAVNSLLGPIRFAFANLTGKQQVFYFSVGYRF